VGSSVSARDAWPSTTSIQHISVSGHAARRKLPVRQVLALCTVGCTAGAECDHATQPSVAESNAAWLWCSSSGGNACAGSISTLVIWIQLHATWQAQPPNYAAAAGFGRLPGCIGQQQQQGKTRGLSRHIQRSPCTRLQCFDAASR